MIDSRKFSGFPQFKIVLLLVALSMILGGCSLFKKQETAVSTPEKLYALASDEYKENNYSQARVYFTRLKEEYPLHDMAVLAEIGIADSYYSDKEYVEAENAYSDFMAMHPVNENVPYAIYQIGMCSYHQMEAIDRDQTETMKARRAWEKLISRYPDSKFSPLAETKLKEVKQKLAQREFYIGSFYLKKKKYQAALARFETIAREYANSGIDIKVKKFIDETKAKIAEEEKEKLEKVAKEKKKAQKEQQKLSREDKTKQ